MTRHRKRKEWMEEEIKKKDGGVCKQATGHDGTSHDAMPPKFKIH
jgi:hypothetical protein